MNTEHQLSISDTKMLLFLSYTILSYLILVTCFISTTDDVLAIFGN